MKKVTAHTQAGKDGKAIVCPKCKTAVRVYHFEWSELQCQNCGDAIKKTAWIVSENKAAVALGRIGGKVKSEVKASAARENAKKQRPRLVTAIAYEFRPKGGGVDCFGLILEKGAMSCDLEKNHDDCIALIEKHAGRECLDLLQFASITRRV